MQTFRFTLATAMAAIGLFLVPLSTQAQGNATVYDVDAGIRSYEFDTFKPVPDTDGIHVYVSKDGWYSFVTPKGGTHQYMEGGNSHFSFGSFDFLTGVKPEPSYANYTPAQLDANATELMQPTSAIYEMAARLGTVTGTGAITLNVDNTALKAVRGAGINLQMTGENGQLDEGVVLAVPSNRGIMIAICFGEHDLCRSNLSNALRLGYGAFVPSGQAVLLDAKGKLTGTASALPKP